jgi:hypothetical protein
MFFYHLYIDMYIVLKACLGYMHRHTGIYLALIGLKILGINRFKIVHGN